MHSLQSKRRRSKRRLGVQSLEQRKLLAADFFSLGFDGFGSDQHAHQPVSMMEFAAPSGDSMFSEMEFLSMPGHAFSETMGFGFASPMGTDGLTFVGGSTIQFGENEIDFADSVFGFGSGQHEVVDMGIPFGEVDFEDAFEVGKPVEVLELTGDETVEEIAAMLENYLGEAIIVDLTAAGGDAGDASETETDDNELVQFGDDMVFPGDEGIVFLDEFMPAFEAYEFASELSPEEIAEQLGIDVEEIVSSEGTLIADAGFEEFPADATPEEIAEALGVNVDDITFVDSMLDGPGEFATFEFGDAVTPEEIAEQLGIDIEELVLNETMPDGVIEAQEFPADATPEEIADALGVDVTDIEFIHAFSVDDVELIEFDADATPEEIADALGIDLADLEFADEVETQAVPSLDNAEVVFADTSSITYTSNGTDVNDDGITTARDALMIVNFMEGSQSQGHMDVNEDDRVSGLDVLVVVNVLGRYDATVDGATSVSDAPSDDISTNAVEVVELDVSDRIEELYQQFVDDVTLVVSEAAANANVDDAIETDVVFSDLSEEGDDESDNQWLDSLIAELAMQF